MFRKKPSRKGRGGGGARRLRGEPGRVGPPGLPRRGSGHGGGGQAGTGWPPGWRGGDRAVLRAVWRGSGQREQPAGGRFFQSFYSESNERRGSGHVGWPRGSAWERGWNRPVRAVFL